MRVGAGGCSGVQWVWVSVGVCGWVRERAKRAGVYPSVCECTPVYASVRDCEGLYRSIREYYDFLILRAKPAHKPKHITI